MKGLAELEETLDGRYHGRRDALGRHRGGRRR